MKRTDMWSTDPSLTDTAVMSLKAWRSREKNALASVLDIGWERPSTGTFKADFPNMSASTCMSMRSGKDYRKEKRSLSILFIKIYVLAPMDQGREMQFDLIFRSYAFITSILMIMSVI
ncbi:hypothetical protein ACEQPO_05610 [Bacillus sp. SL00103]